MGPAPTAQPPGGGARSAETSRPTVMALAAGLGVVDALLFRRVSPTVWAHLGGLGRGRGWAGLVDVDANADPLAARIPDRIGDLRRVRFTEASRVLGPYYATAAALIRTGNDVAVVLGTPDGDLADAPDDRFRELADLLDAAIDDVLPSKRLADEIEVLHTVQALMAAPIDAGLPETLHHLVAVATEALSCDVGLLRDGAGRLAIVANGGTAPAPGSTPAAPSRPRWPSPDATNGEFTVTGDGHPATNGDTARAMHVTTPAVSAGARDAHAAGAVATPPDADWHAALDEIAVRMDGSSWCAQDTAAIGTLRLSDMLPGTRSLLAVPVPEPVGGLLVMVHTDRGPRGFTNQCRRLGLNVVETGSIVARTAALRDELRAAAERASHAARTDPLTGLGNRLTWDETVAAAQERVDAGATVCVLTLDVDGLKQINDEHGHAAGDDLLRRCADAIRRHCEPGDVAVRMGGDEFAILIARGEQATQAMYDGLAGELGARHSSPDTVAASIGVGIAGPGGRLSDAVRDADVQMYRHKRERRRQSEGDAERR